MEQKPTINMFRSMTTEIYDENDTLIGYVEEQGEYIRERYLDTYNVVLIDDVNPDVSNLSYDPRFNDL